jgi:hypothetical protein
LTSVSVLGCLRCSFIDRSPQPVVAGNVDQTGAYTRPAPRSVRRDLYAVTCQHERQAPARVRSAVEEGCALVLETFSPAG